MGVNVGSLGGGTLGSHETSGFPGFPTIRSTNYQGFLAEPGLMRGRCGGTQCKVTKLVQNTRSRNDAWLQLQKFLINLYYSSLVPKWGSNSWADIVCLIVIESVISHHKIRVKQKFVVLFWVVFSVRCLPAVLKYSVWRGVCHYHKRKSLRLSNFNNKNELQGEFISEVTKNESTFCHPTIATCVSSCTELFFYSFLSWGPSKQLIHVCLCPGVSLVQVFDPQNSTEMSPDN